MSSTSATRRVQQDEQDEGIITSDYGGGGAGRRRSTDPGLIATPTRNSPNLHCTPGLNPPRSRSAQPGEFPRLRDNPETTVAERFNGGGGGDDPFCIGGEGMGVEESLVL
jgi:hypothetical protein